MRHKCRRGRTSRWGLGRRTKGHVWLQPRSTRGPPSSQTSPRAPRRPTYHPPCRHLLHTHHASTQLPPCVHPTATRGGAVDAVSPHAAAGTMSCGLCAHGTLREALHRGRCRRRRCAPRELKSPAAELRGYRRLWRLQSVSLPWRLMRRPARLQLDLHPRLTTRKASRCLLPGLVAAGLQSGSQQGRQRRAGRDHECCR